MQCPVPKHQRPLSEYNELKTSFGFTWTTEGPSSFLKEFSYISVIRLLLSLLLAKFLWIISASFLFFTTWMLRLYLGWLYIYNRLMNATITYEESGWYDGQTWIKTNDILIQDRLVGVYEVLPVLKTLTISYIFFYSYCCNRSLFNFKTYSIKVLSIKIIYDMIL
uniref:Putative plastid protein 36 n=1 Tax=Cryptomonas curvata TaxID=233186 RepID=A0A222AHF6_9CRYP|nr:putative plastid protein 36 [Cryptomonas curvata]ASO75799.1 putative plastid protein 36 [Cryptomonas curvata]